MKQENSTSADQYDLPAADVSDSSSAATNRRTFLGLAGAGVAGATLASLIPSGVAAASEYDDQYETVIDVVEAGADNTGSEPIDDLLVELRGDDTLLVFPPGRYLMTEQFRYTGFENFGLVGDDATIVPGSIEAVDGNVVTEGTFDGAARLFRLGVIYSPGQDLRFEGFDFDFTAESSGLRAVEAYVSDGMQVRDIDVLGQHDTGTFGPALFCVTDDDGVGTVEGFRAPDGGAFSENTVGDIDVGPTGMLISSSHAGKLWVRDCELGEFPDNGLYVSGADGRVVVEGGVYRNSNVANIRLAGDYSYVRNATVVVDDRREGHNQRGIRLDEGEHLWVYNTDIRLSEPNGHAITVMNESDSARIQESTVTIGDRANHGIVINPYAGAVDVLDTDIEINGGGHALQIQGENADDERVLVRRTTVTGDASGASGRNAIRCERANCEFDDLTVDQPGPDYRRAIEIHGENCELTGGTYVSTHHPIVDVVGTEVADVTARSYDGYQALKLLESSDGATIVDNELYGGYLDKGATNLTMSGNSFPDW